MAEFVCTSTDDDNESGPETPATRSAATARREAAARDAERDKREREEKGRQEQHQPESTPPAPPALACRCGNTIFAAPLSVQLVSDGTVLTATVVPAPVSLPYTCLSCGDTGDLAALKERLRG